MHDMPCVWRSPDGNDDDIDHDDGHFDCDDDGQDDCVLSEDALCTKRGAE